MRLSQSIVVNPECTQSEGIFMLKKKRKMKPSYLANILLSNIAINLIIIHIYEALTKTCNILCPLYVLSYLFLITVL